MEIEEEGHESKEKFECGDCGCYYWVKDRNNFSCPNCEDKKSLKNKMEREKRIRELKNLIKSMREDGEVFGLVSEDIEKINKWVNEIKKLNLEKNKNERR